MYRLFAPRNHNRTRFGGYALLILWGLWLCSSSGVWAQGAATPLNTNAPFSLQATHLMGLPNTKSNCNGTLTIQDNLLQFRQKGKPGEQISTASIRNLFLGEESKQVGGLPVKLGKAAAPYGGGRVVSLFAHKKYDTVTLEYVDSDGGLHGAIFQVTKGQGELVRSELVARGVSSSSGEDQRTKQSSLEVAHEKSKRISWILLGFVTIAVAFSVGWPARLRRRSSVEAVIPAHNGACKCDGSILANWTSRILSKWRSTRTS